MARKLHEALKVYGPPVMSITEEFALTTATRLILSGKVIAVPTDTVYGIAASAQNNHSIKRLYEIKKRDKMKPLAICLGEVSEIEMYGDTSHLDKALLECLLPGAVTIILKRKDLLSLLLNPNTDLVGIRIPKCSFIRNLARACQVPLALTSANLSTKPSPLQISEFYHLWPLLGGIFDGGLLGENRAGSTVIDLSEPGCFNIIRPGSDYESTLAIVEKFGLKQNLRLSSGKAGVQLSILHLEVKTEFKTVAK